MSRKTSRRRMAEAAVRGMRKRGECMYVRRADGVYRLTTRGWVLVQYEEVLR